MADYQITIARSASREFEKLPKSVMERIRVKIRSLSSTPRPPGVKKLRGSQNTWRIRVGDWRILYEIDDEHMIVDIAAIRHRSEAYE